MFMLCCVILFVLVCMLFVLVVGLVNVRDYLKEIEGDFIVVCEVIKSDNCLVLMCVVKCSCLSF